jgi:hypothetical protein
MRLERSSHRARPGGFRASALLSPEIRNGSRARASSAKAREPPPRGHWDLHKRMARDQFSPRPGTPERGVGGEGLRLSLYLDWQKPGISINDSLTLVDVAGIPPHPHPRRTEARGGTSLIFVGFSTHFQYFPTSVDPNALAGTTGASPVAGDLHF